MIFILKLMLQNVFFANANIQLNSGLITARVNIWQYSNYFWSFRFFLLWCMYLKNSLFGFIVRTFSPSAVLSISSSSIFVWLILTSPSHQSVFIVICSVKLKKQKIRCIIIKINHAWTCMKMRAGWTNGSPTVCSRSNRVYFALPRWYIHQGRCFLRFMTQSKSFSYNEFFNAFMFCVFVLGNVILESELVFKIFFCLKIFNQILDVGPPLKISRY